MNKAKSYALFARGPILLGIFWAKLSKDCDNAAWYLLDILLECGFSPKMPQC